MKATNATAAAIVMLAALAPAAAGASAAYTTGTFVAFCFYTCEDAGAGFVIFDVPDGTSSVDISIDDALDYAGVVQEGAYQFYDKDAGEHIGNQTGFCDTASISSVPSEADMLDVVVWSGASDAIGWSEEDPCPDETQVATAGEVVATFS